MILITGANGFVGKHLVDYFLSTGSKVRCLSRNKIDNVECVYGNVLDSSLVEKAVHGCDYIIHTAAIINPTDKNIEKVNVELTRNLVNAAIKYNVKKLVFISSQVVLHNDIDKYVTTKKTGEEIVSHFKNHVILRPTMVYGPNDKRYVTKFIKIIKSWPFIPIIGNGKNNMHLIYVLDLVRAIDVCIKQNVLGTYVLTGETISYNKLTSIIENELNIKRLKLRIPINFLKYFVFVYEKFASNPKITRIQLNRMSSEIKNDLVMPYINDIKKLKIKTTPLKEGICEVIHSMK